MTDLIAKRTLVKSPPELWAELSEVESLAQHLGEFGEIRITRSEPQSTVAWEGEHVSGTVELEESGWGTKVTLKAVIEGAEPKAEPEPDPERAPEPEPPVVEVQPTAESPAIVGADAREPAERRRLWSRWRRRRRRADARPERLSDGPAPVMAAAISDGTLTVVEKGHVPRRPAEEITLEEPTGEEEAAPDPQLPGLDVEQALTVLESTLDNLGSAHHRPFSRE